MATNQIYNKSTFRHYSKVAKERGLSEREEVEYFLDINKRRVLKKLGWGLSMNK